MTQTLKYQSSYCLWRATLSSSRFPVNDVWWCISCVSDIFVCVIYCILLPVQLTGKTPIENEQWCDDWDNLWLLLSVQCVIAVSVNLAYWWPCPRCLVDSGIERIDPLHFLAGCHKRRLNRALSVLSLSLGFFWVSFMCFITLCSFVFCLLVVCVRLSVPVQEIDWKDSSTKWPIMCWWGC